MKWMRWKYTKQKENWNTNSDFGFDRENLCFNYINWKTLKECCKINKKISTLNPVSAVAFSIDSITSIYSNLLSDKSCFACDAKCIIICALPRNTSFLWFKVNLCYHLQHYHLQTHILTLKLPSKTETTLYIFNNKSNQTQNCENITLRGYKWFANSTFFSLYVSHSKDEKKYDEKKKSIKSLEKNIFHLKRPIAWFIVVVLYMIFASEAKRKTKVIFR